MLKHRFFTTPDISTSAVDIQRTLTDIQQPVNATRTPEMRLSLRLLASAAAGPKSRSLRPAPMALLPPIPLYRRLLRAHRKFLPHDMRMLGDEYIKAEFRAHRKVDNPQHLVGCPPPSLPSGGGFDSRRICSR
jgi:hypothetical protein